VCQLHVPCQVNGEGKCRTIKGEANKVLQDNVHRELLAGRKLKKTTLKTEKGHKEALPHAESATQILKEVPRIAREQHKPESESKNGSTRTGKEWAAWGFGTCSKLIRPRDNAMATR